LFFCFSTVADVVASLCTVKACSIILLQATPTEIDLSSLKEEVRSISGVVNVHDLHCWQLVNDLPICSLHVAIEEGTDFNILVAEVKELLHEYGIHSSTIQPEFVHRYSKVGCVGLRVVLLGSVAPDWCSPWCSRVCGVQCTLCFSCCVLSLVRRCLSAELC
jgi:hypothetical protein